MFVGARHSKTLSQGTTSWERPEVSPLPSSPDPCPEISNQIDLIPFRTQLALVMDKKRAEKNYYIFRSL